jgi:hypothetical protein
MWHSNDACFDDDGGDMRRRGGGLWEEMEGELWGMSGRDLHDGWGGRERGEQGEKSEQRAGDVQAK